MENAACSLQTGDIVYMHACMHACMHVCVCMHGYTHICMCDYAFTAGFPHTPGQCRSNEVLNRHPVRPFWRRLKCFVEVIRGVSEHVWRTAGQATKICIHVVLDSNLREPFWDRI